MPRVRVIGSDGEMVGVLSRDEALAKAEEEGLDLVEIQPQADPPVCKIMDFGKFKFEQQKKANEAKKKTKQVEIKELKFRPVTDEGDFWEKRDMKGLVQEVGEWNEGMAALVGKLKDMFGDDFDAPIAKYPDFEHLEANGRKKK